MSRGQIPRRLEYFPRMRHRARKRHTFGIWLSNHNIDSERELIWTGSPWQFVTQGGQNELDQNWVYFGDS